MNERTDPREHESSTESFEVAVLGAGVFTPRFPTLNDWVARSEAPEPIEPSGEAIERRSRRRASELTKALADAYGAAIAASGVDPATIPTVFGSALGEASTMIGLLDQMWRDGEALSPMKFAMSVHNAASGAISISAGNRAFTTSLGADFDTPAMSLAEGMALVRSTGGPVCVVCGDDAVPRDIVPEELAWSLVAGALVIAPVDAAPTAARLRGPHTGASSGVHAPAPPSIERNPVVGLLDLIDALQVHSPQTVRCDRGAGFGWCFDVNPSADP